MTDCVVALATRDRQYPGALERLRESLDGVGFGGRRMIWPPGRLPPGCPPHDDVPYAFKPFCLVEARRLGMRRVLWMDSSCVAVRSLESIFERIASRGYVLVRNRRYRVGEWSSDLTLEAMGIGRDEALRLPELNCAVLGLDLSTEIGTAFLDRWHRAATRGDAFRGVAEVGGDSDLEEIKWNRAGRASSDPRVRGHRFDQSVAGIIAGELRMRPTGGGLVTTYSRARPHIRRRARIVIDRDAARVDGELSTFPEVIANRDRRLVGPLRRRLGDTRLPRRR